MSAEEEKQTEIERRLEQDGVGTSRPVPPAGLADQIKASIPEELFPPQANQAGTGLPGATGSSQIGKPGSLQRWAIAASILAAVFVGVFALRMGIRSPETGLQSEMEKALVEPAADSDAPEGEDGTASVLLERSDPALRKQAEAPAQATDGERDSKLEDASEEAVAQSNDQTAIPVPPAQSAPLPGGESSRPEADRFVVSESMAVTAEAEEAVEGREDLAQLPASPKRARGRLERASLPELEGWVDLFLSQASRERDTALGAEGLADAAEMERSRRVVAGRSAVVRFACPDQTSAADLFAGLSARQQNDRAMEAAAPVGDPPTVVLREFRVWTRESLLERLQELQLVGGEFSCTLAFLESGSSDD